MNKIKLILVVIIINACSINNCLTNSDIIKIVDSSKEIDSIKPNKYFHFKIKKKYKNTFSGTLLNNRYLPNTSDTLSRIINFKGTFIFVYDKCTKLKNKKDYFKNRYLISTSENSPFFMLSESNEITMRIEKKDSILIVEKYEFKVINRFPNQLDNIDW